MSERYSRLFALSENQYASDSPVVIAAGALLKDNQTGKVIAQLKLRNISSKRIKAATVCIVPFDTVGNLIGDSVSYQYLDLNAKRNEDFGQKAAIALPNAATRSFAATVEEIAFVDNTIWKATGEPWEVLPAQSSFDRTYGVEFTKQLCIKYGAGCKYIPLAEKDLWYCTCGALNSQKEDKCHACGKSYAVLSNLDYDTIRTEMETRIAAEKEQAVKDAVAAKAKTKKAIKITAIAIPILAIMVAAAILLFGMIAKSNAYKGAVALMNAGQYENAIEEFKELDGYKDSSEQIKIAESAIAELERIAELEAQYNKAINLLHSDVSGNENEAYHILIELGDYKDAEEFILKFRYAVISEISEVIDVREPFETVYEYDTKGWLASKTEADGDVYTYAYDSEGRVIKEVLNDGTIETEYSYYENGIRKQIVTKTRQGTVTTDFDVHGSPVKGVYTYFGFTWEFNYTYSENGNIDVIECLYFKNGEEQRNTFRMAEIGENITLSHEPDDILPVFKSRSTDGKEVEYIIYYDYFSGIQLKENYTREYASNGNLVQEKQRDGTDGLDRSYSYDANDNLIQITTSYLSGMKIQNDYIYGYIYTPDAV